MGKTSCLVRNSACTRKFNPSRVLVAVLSVLFLPVIAAYAQNPGSAPIHIPVTMWQKNSNGIKKPRISIGVGQLQLPVSFDTGSTGLHMFLDANLTEDNSGVKCTDVATSVTYGNPARIIFSGIECYAPLQFGSYVSPQPVRIAYLTSAVCAPGNEGCTIPDLTSPEDMGGYGILGLGLTGVQTGDHSIPNPILTFSPPYNSYSVQLTNDDVGGELVLGSEEPANAVPFQLNQPNPTDPPGTKWRNALTCLFVGRSALDTCLQISFDTGNPAPWIHNASTAGIPEDPPGFIAPSTTMGFAPLCAPTPAFSLVAGATPFVDQIPLVDIKNAASLTNVSIEAFFGQIVTYNNDAGTISFAPLNSPLPH